MSEKLKRISVITINYNNCEGLYKTIESVLRQTYPMLEYIVIDGGSTDGSVDVIKVHEKKIIYWVSEPDRGIYHAMNKGVERATGDYCLFLNSGDCLISNTILEDISHELISGEDVIFGLLQCYPSGKIGYADIHLPLTLLDFFKLSPIPHPASFIKRSLFLNFKYDEKLKIVSDWKFFLQVLMLNGGTCKKVEKPITLFEEQGLSSNFEICDKERLLVSKELLPKAIFADYFKFTYQMDYREGNYETFFTRLHKYRYSKLIYVVSVILVRGISIFKNSARFAREYPLL